MKVYLDDERPTPLGSVAVRWPEEAIRLLETGRIAELSLDHDLGADARGTGYTAILWLEEAVAVRGFDPPAITVHTANAAAREKMLLGVQSIHQLAQRPAEPNAPADGGGE
ncbi:MAG: cyclic-phosphate processing receiver domain-containing protein [Planctomycetota bacterium]